MKQQKAYLIGIKGVGMTALAIYLKQAGYEVTGSDVTETFVTDKLLTDAGISVLEFNKDNVKKEKYDLLIVSAAYNEENPEVAEAKRRKLNLKYYSDILGEVSSNKKVIAVSGIHGKTTTTAMISFILEKAGLDPSFIIGSGEVPGLKNSAHSGTGDIFVLEADEYRKSPEDNTPKFLSITPNIAIITSIEMDHPDVFPTVEEVYDAFYRLTCRVPRTGFIVLCVDYPKAKKLSQTIADRDFETYGFDISAKWKIVNLIENENKNTFSLENKGKVYGPYELKIIGRHNVLNATAAIITALKLDIPEKDVKHFISNFKNAKRRLEKIGETNGITILDDYAHHPTAIKLTLDAIKKKYPGQKIICIFQPHTYSRTEKLLTEFSRSFSAADRVIITDIFSSAREKTGHVTGEDLVEEIKKYKKNVKYMTDFQKIQDYILSSIKAPVVVLTVGAGDIYKLSESINKTLDKRKKNE
jgi:UDP-N-acetylmuramate--alanine ligase